MPSQEIYVCVVNLLSNVLDAYTTAFFLYDPEARRFQVQAMHSLSKRVNESAFFPENGSGILSQVHKVGHTVHLNKVTLDELQGPLPFYLEGEGHIKGVFVTPVADRLGILYVDTKKSWGFNDKERKWILETARLLEKLMFIGLDRAQKGRMASIHRLWHDVLKLGLRQESQEQLARVLAESCRDFLQAEHVLVAHHVSGEPEYRLLAFSPVDPRNLVGRRYPLGKAGLFSKLFRGGGAITIPVLNPEAKEHFILYPQENIPHRGSCWGVVSRQSRDHALAFLATRRDRASWKDAEKEGVTHLVDVFCAFCERLDARERVGNLCRRHPETGCLNDASFEELARETLAAAIQESAPLSLAVVQYEPWQYGYCHVDPRLVRKWRHSLAKRIRRDLPADAEIGLLGENRFACLFPGWEYQRTIQWIESMDAVRRSVPEAVRYGLRIQAFYACVSYPTDGVTMEELWMELHRRLLELFRC